MWYLLDILQCYATMVLDVQGIYHLYLRGVLDIMTITD